MPISVTCPTCASKIKASDNVLGRQARCPKCGQPIVFAAPAGPATDSASPPARAGAQGGKYYVRDHQGKVSGPYSAADLKRLAGEKKLDLSWQISEDRVHWGTAAKVKNLFGGLEAALAANLNTEAQYRDLRRQEVVALFLDKFILNNENFKDSFPFLQPDPIRRDPPSLGAPGTPAPAGRPRRTRDSLRGADLGFLAVLTWR